MELIPDVIIKRAVELQCRKLFTPKFDNGDNSDSGFIGSCLATINIHNAKSCTDDLPGKVEVFRVSLTKALIKSRDDELEGSGCFNSWLDVDYHPCETLRNAAKEAGIPESLFSCKSTVDIRHNCVTESFGYGAETFFHYQLLDGRWLITSLSGSDIDKIKEQVMNGSDLGLTIEEVA